MKKFCPKIIALGGSIVVPNEIDIEYLKRLHAFFVKYIEEGNDPVILVIGGGYPARQYQDAASAIVEVSDEDKDWIGIHATRSNAQLIRTIFADICYPVVLDNPHKYINKSDLEDYSLFVASGGFPGHSTDYDAVALAQRFGASGFYIATTIPYVYDKDFSKYKDASPIKDLTWADYRSLISESWTPGMKAPVDPIAATAASKSNLFCHLFKGNNLANLENCIFGREFEGSVIHS